MGIHLNLALILRDWVSRHDVTGPALTLGVRDTAFTRIEFERAIGLPAPADANGPESNMTPGSLFDAVGLDGVQSLDVSDYEGADFIFDLNEPQLPPDLRRRFGLVMNGGTLEHVFHVPNALANLGAMLRRGGAVLHVLPCNNWVDHGFYQFSPTLMFDYYAAMGYDILESAMVIFNPRRQGGHNWEVRPQPIGALSLGRVGQLDDRTYQHLILVRKGPESLERAVPIQSTHTGRIARPRVGPRWFSAYELRYGTRVDHPNRGIYPLRGFVRDEGFAWSAPLPELERLADTSEMPVRSPLILLEDRTALGPAHQPHTAVRDVGGGSFSHWGPTLYLSTSDGSDPNTNGRTYAAIMPNSFEN